jgi:hypothetical protein
VSDNDKTLAETMKAAYPPRDESGAGHANDTRPRRTNVVQPVDPPPAKAGDVVQCLVCSGKGYVHSLHHVVCRVCKGTRTVTIEEYR